MKNSTLRQTLIDLKSACTSAGGRDDIIAQAKALIETLDRDPIIEDDTEKLFQSHQYRNLKFSRVSTFEESPEALLVPLNLSNSAARLLMILERIAIRQEIQMSYVQVAKLLGVSEKSARRALSELIKSGILIEVVPAHGREAKIFRLNSCIYKVGKTLACPEDEKQLPYQIDKPEYPGVAPSVEKIAARARWDELKNGITVCHGDFNGEKHTYIRLSL